MHSNINNNNNNNNNNNYNNNMPVKLSYENRENMNFEKRYQEPLKPFIPIQNHLEIQTYDKGPLPLPFPSPYSGINKYSNIHDEPIKLVKQDRRLDIDEDDDEDRLLVIARSNEEDSDHGSSDRADDSV